MAENTEHAVRGSVVAAAGGFLPAVVFLSSAHVIIARNLLDLSYHPGIALGFAAAFVIASGITVPLFLRSRHARWARAIGRACLAAGLGILVLDGVDVLCMDRVPSFAILVAAEEIAVLAVAAVMIWAPWSLLLRVFGVTAPVLALQTVGSHLLMVHGLRAEAPRATSTLIAAETATPGNVYHILLDAFQSEAYPALTAADPDLALPGFTYYPEFVVNYDTTRFSLAATLTGRYYRPDERMAAWLGEQYTGGLWAHLVAGGVRLDLYPYFDLQCPPLPGRCTPGQDPPPIPTRGTGAGTLLEAPARTTLDLWFLSLLPRSARMVLNRGWAHVNDPPEAGADLAHARFSITGRLWPLPVEDPRNLPVDYTSARSVPSMRRVIAEEPARPAHGQYVFVHLLLPHLPYVVDEYCRYGGPEGPRTVDGYMAQAVCSLRLVHELVDELRALGRYDDALIIVHGDHGILPELADAFRGRYGSYAAPPERPASTVDPRTDTHEARVQRVPMRSRALLLVKFPGSGGPDVDPARAESLDLAPTVLAHFGLATDGDSGVPLQTLHADVHRTRWYFAGIHKRAGGGPKGDRFTEFVFRSGRWEYVKEVPTRD